MRSLSWRARRSRHHHYAASTAHSAQRAPDRFPGHVASLAARRRRSEGAQDRVGESLRVTGRKFFAKDDSTQVEGSADEVLGDLEVGVRRDFPRSIARRSIPSPACRLGFRNRAQHARRFSGRLVARQPLVHQIDRLVEGTGSQYPLTRPSASVPSRPHMCPLILLQILFASVRRRPGGE